MSTPIEIETYEGGCHCGAIGWRFQTRIEPSDWLVRACQCSFCRVHGARCTSDPAGTAQFLVSDEAALRRYRFGLETADFIVCANCGVYIGAIIGDPSGGFTTLNLNTMRTTVEGLRNPTAISYDSEDREERINRRRSRWTPVAAVI